MSIGSVFDFRDQYDPVLQELSGGSGVALVGTENVSVKNFDIRYEFYFVIDTSLSFKR